jgi:hypothetical protein
MRLIEWEVNEDSYQEQILIPEAQRQLAAREGISTENKQTVAARIQNLTTGETYTARLAITGNRQLYLLTTGGGWRSSKAGTTWRWCAAMSVIPTIIPQIAAGKNQIHLGDVRLFNTGA